MAAKELGRSGEGRVHQPEVDSCSAAAAQWLVLFQRGWEHDGFQQVLVRRRVPVGTGP